MVPGLGRDRGVIETVLAIAPRGALDDEVRVEIDAFLEAGRSRRGERRA